MSLSIDIAKVGRVRIGEKWVSIEVGTFTVDTFEFLDGEKVVHGGGQARAAGAGFSFMAHGDIVATMGPLSSITAVQYADH